MALYTRLPVRAATAYAELFEAARTLELQRSVGALTGSFATKTVKGRLYWYFQYRDVDDAVRQLYVGPDDERVRELVARKESLADVGQLTPLARSAIELGCEPLVPQHFRLIRRMAEYGFFRAGGVLIGTHAFSGLSSALAVRWSAGSRTEDVDLAYPDKHLEIALPASISVDVRDAIDSLQEGFLPTSAFNASGSAATYVSAKNDMRIDFLTTRKQSDAPTLVANLNVAMQPLPYLELLLEHPIQIALLARDGALVVNVPDPIALALHKLIVAMSRGPSWRTKSTKDLSQAAALLEVLAETDSDALAIAWRNAQKRGPTWKKKLHDGRKALTTVSTIASAALPD